MGMITRTHIQKILYAITFCIVLPVGLILWARYSQEDIALAVPFPSAVGLVLLIAGLALMTSSMLAIYHYGKGLPMNAFPPEHFVSRGPYWLFGHPIYIGFAAVAAGLAIYLRSSSGFWLVFPVTSASLIALVLGYESHATKELFGNEVKLPFLRLPADERHSISIADLFSSIVLILIPFLVLLGLQSSLTKIWWIVVSLLCFTIVLFSLATKMQSGLRRFIQESWTLFAINLLIVFLFSEQNILILSSSIWLLTRRPLGREYNILGRVFPLSALAIAVGTLQFDSIVVLFSIAFGLAASSSFTIWRWMLECSEWLANSWEEWRWGPARIINHGSYPGLGITVGLLIMFYVAAPKDRWLFVAFSFACIAGAGIWGQLVEGSSKLARPYGYYGGTFAVLILSPLSAIAGLDPWYLLAAIGLAGPWIQAFGRLRCLVQGCCHGAPTDPGHGIVYSNPVSRVIRISELGHTPLLPTQLYSIVWNASSGIILAGLWSHSFACSFISGIYFLLNGVGRFVEESRRGESQTKTIWGMRTYQWLAILSVIIGIVFTSIQSQSAPRPNPLGWSDVAIAIAFGLFTWFAYGVDFPESHKRFARLT
jgi:protein-S-isoprenylcysteine O-methyltransferase Ste14